MLLLILAATLSTSWAKVEAVVGIPTDENQNLAMAVPDTMSSEILISREQYLISYNKNHRAPNWVAWKLEKNQLGSSGRSNKFRQDPDLENYLSQNDSGFHAVTETEYDDSCFDRGHQIPSGDRSDKKTNNEMTFVMSNMIPQTPYLNQVIWEHLEQYTRDLVLKEGKKAYVIAGPIYDVDFGAIGPNRDIPVPSKDFKVIYVLDANQSPSDIDVNNPTIAVIMPNTLSDGSIPVPYTSGCKGVTDLGSDVDDWKQYQTSLSDIESKSGLTFH